MSKFFFGCSFLLILLAASCSPGEVALEATPSLPPPEATAILSVTQQFTPPPWFDSITAGVQGEDNALYDKPTALAAAPDDTLYVATSGQSYIFHIDRQGQVLVRWGGYVPVAQGEKAPPGAFNQIWGLALGKDGSVYAADLFNHRIQKFTADGEFLLAWGEGEIGSEPDQFFGPRGLAADSYGHVIVADTGNKRLVVYDGDGQYLSQIGGEGRLLGQFNEPTGIAVDGEGRVYVADAWNSRIQVLSIDDVGVLTPLSSWQVQGLDVRDENFKPFLCLLDGVVYVTVPRYDLVQSFTSEGTLLQRYDLRKTGVYSIGTPTAIIPGPQGGL